MAMAMGTPMEEGPPYRCHNCSNYYQTQVELRNHVNDGSCSGPPVPVAKYDCPHCNRSFFKKVVLKNHIMTHTGERPYNCYVCGQKFRRSHHRKRHMEGVHNVTPKSTRGPRGTKNEQQQKKNFEEVTDDSNSSKNDSKSSDEIDEENDGVGKDANRKSRSIANDAKQKLTNSSPIKAGLIKKSLTPPKKSPKDLNKSLKINGILNIDKSEDQFMTKKMYLNSSLKNKVANKIANKSANSNLNSQPGHNAVNMNANVSYSNGSYSNGNYSNGGYSNGSYSNGSYGNLSGYSHIDNQNVYNALQSALEKPPLFTNNISNSAKDAIANIASNISNISGGYITVPPQFGSNNNNNSKQPTILNVPLQNITQMYSVTGQLGNVFPLVSQMMGSATSAISTPTPEPEYSIETSVSFPEITNAWSNSVEDDLNLLKCCLCTSKFSDQLELESHFRDHVSKQDAAIGES